jgi:hypothetical protein
MEKYVRCSFDLVNFAWFLDVTKTTTVPSDLSIFPLSGRSLTSDHHVINRNFLATSSFVLTNPF